MNNKKKRLFKKWKKYLSDSRLSRDEIYIRSMSFTRQGIKP